jgi:hypothetical protein
MASHGKGENIQHTPLEKKKEAKKLMDELRELEKMERMRVLELARRREELMGKLEDLERTNP